MMISRRKELPISNETLCYLYQEKLMSPQEIARHITENLEFPVGSGLIQSRLKEIGILRNRSESNRVKNKKYPELARKFELRRKEYSKSDENLKKLARMRENACADPRLSARRKEFIKTACKIAAVKKKAKTPRTELTCALCGRVVVRLSRRVKEGIQRLGFQWLHGEELPEMYQSFCTRKCWGRYQNHQRSIQASLRKAMAATSQGEQS